MKRNVRSILVTLSMFVALSGVGLLQSSTAMADGADTFTVTERTPFDMIVELPCAGEYVHLTGE